MYRILNILALAGISQAAYDPTTPIVKMADYKSDTRTLDCWQCFDADGFMCHEETHKSQIKATGSSNRAHGACCKPGFTGEHCNNETNSDGTTHSCSQPASGPGAGFKDVLTSGKNHQMFAFCPSTGNQKTCGISDDATGLDMTLTATADLQTITLGGEGSLQYKTSASGVVKKYDSCYYLIVADKSLAAEYKYLNVKVTKIEDANAYLYGGKSKSDSKKSVVKDNAALKEGQTYIFDASVGGFLVAYPNKDKETHFEFSYRAGTMPPASESGGMGIGLIIGIVVAVLVLILILVAVMKIRKNKEQNNNVTPFENEEVVADDKQKDDVGVIELPQKEGETNSKGETEQ